MPDTTSVSPIEQTASAICTFQSVSALDREKKASVLQEEEERVKVTTMTAESRTALSTFEDCVLTGIKTGHLPAKRFADGYILTQDDPYIKATIFVRDSGELFLLQSRMARPTGIFLSSILFSAILGTISGFVLLAAPPSDLISAFLPIAIMFFGPVLATIVATPLHRSLRSYRCKPLSTLLDNPSLLTEFDMSLYTLSSLIQNAQALVLGTLSELSCRRLTHELDL